MANTRVTLIGEQYDCNRALFDGAVRVPGVELAGTRAPSPEAMRRQLRDWEFDVCEMAFGAYLIAREQGADVTAIPVFPRRSFFQSGFVYDSGRGAVSPDNLGGMRIGVAEYVQSATIWARGVLEDDFRLDPRSVGWFVERHGPDSTGEMLGFRPPTTLSVEHTAGHRSLADALAAGELDVAMVGRIPPGADGERLRPLFPDPDAEGNRYFATHGFVPANHTYMVSGKLARENPGLIADLYRAFGEARDVAASSLPADRPIGTLFGNESLARTCAAFPGDPFAYGIESNRDMLETVVRLCAEQGLITSVPTVDELFAGDLG